jgi:hypothetical protein
MRALLIKGNLIWQENFKIWMFKNSIGIFQGVIKFIEGLIARKIGF